MSLPFTKEQIRPLTLFLELLKNNPGKLHSPELSFLKEFVEHFGGKIPTTASTQKNENPTAQQPASATVNEPEPEEESESEESELELDMSAVIEPDVAPTQEMGDPQAVPDEEALALSQTKRSEAVAAFAEKDYERAVKLYTEAIALNSQAALLYSKRGQAYLMLQKPNACIHDCDHAIRLNPDSAAAHKFRGRAKHLLGQFEEAAADLRLACQFDFDEQADEWLREVTPNARKIEEHKRKYQRKLNEKTGKQGGPKMKRKATAETKAPEGNSGSEQTEAPGSAGARSKQPGINDFYQYLSDPNVIQDFEDPEVGKAFQDVEANPANILKYQNNPKVMNVINKAVAAFGLKFGEEAKNAGKTDEGGPKPSAPSPDDDVGLD